MATAGFRGIAEVEPQGDFRPDDDGCALIAQAHRRADRASWIRRVSPVFTE